MCNGKGSILILDKQRFRTHVGETLHHLHRTSPGPGSNVQREPSRGVRLEKQPRIGPNHSFDDFDRLASPDGDDQFVVERGHAGMGLWAWRVDRLGAREFPVDSPVENSSVRRLRRLLLLLLLLLLQILLSLVAFAGKNAPPAARVVWRQGLRGKC
jgi:hypothetical protein